MKALSFFLVLIAVLIRGTLPAPAQEASVKAKQFPASYFYQFYKAPVPEKEKVLARIDATLQKLDQEGFGLIAKGAVIEKLSPDQKIYAKLTILDESGLIIMARQVPNLYYQYRGPGAINPNIYLVLKHARVNFPESYIRYGFVVEGEYVAYAHKFVNAILEGLERAGNRPNLPPVPPPR
ncbi:MAG: hypothetical protein WC443_07260 [Desulfobaccales bacterium]